MSRRANLIAFPALLLLAASAASFAGGAAEAKAETAFKAYLLVADKEMKNDLTVTQTLLPPVMGLYAWSPFTVTDGVPRVSSDSTYSTLRRNGSSAGKAGAFRLLVHDMAVVFAGSPSGKAGREIRIEFKLADLTTASGDVRSQPAAWAAVEAARKSGMKSGSLRVLEAVPAGGDGFRARVEVR